MAKTANNSFGSDTSGIVIWKHNTMGHMDSSVEEAIARLVRKQQEGLVNSQSLVSFASESAVVDKPKKGFLKRFLAFGKKDSSEGGSSEPVGGLVIKDKSSSFETSRSRGSSTEDIRQGRSEFRVFRDGKGAAVVARSDGRNFKDLAKKAREAGFPDLARQIETAEPRQPRLNSSRNGRGAHPTPSEIIDRVRARNKERMGRSVSGSASTAEAQFYGEIPIRSAEDLKAHRAELAKNRNRLAALKQKEALVEADQKGTDEAGEPPSRRESLQPLESLERAAMVHNWLQSGNITGNPVLYPDPSPEGPGVPTSVGPPPHLALSPGDAPVPDLLELEDRVLFSQKQTEEGLLTAPGKGLRPQGGSPGEADKPVGAALLDRSSFTARADCEGGKLEGPEGAPGAKGAVARNRSPLTKPPGSRKSQEQRFLGGAGSMMRSASDRPASGENGEGPRTGLLRTTSEIAGLVHLRQAFDSGVGPLEAEPGSGKGRLSDGLRPSLRTERGGGLAPGGSPVPWGGFVAEVGPGRAKTPEPVGLEPSPQPGVLVTPMKGLGLEPKRASPSGLAWSPLEKGSPLQSPRPLPGPVDDISPRPKMVRQSSGRSEPRQEAASGEDEERYDPAQWHKYLQTRLAQVLPNLSSEAPQEVLVGGRAAPPGGDIPGRKDALPLPLPPGLHPLPPALHPLPPSSGPPNWPFKIVDQSPYDFDASGGATPRSSASFLSELPHSPSSPLMDLLLSPHGAHAVEAWHVPPAYSG
ncbi:hypothetical protein KFL_002690010 [Klebsormidium nitens]|uniref:Uncharacterized protein n=1 Tax=Klebsormidium nitens TaxID=105231 RepID=A0A1Y1IBI9_KLENI|nr:hypothetical protein KFL_002690010 [Klebsormidium nitens]|eukprot:GAQ86076.1 hypothetical protein KFL_002690010 [Klebsormidium nitens]